MFDLSFLEQTGYIGKIAAGLQFDFNSAFYRTSCAFAESNLCDHNCTLEFGNYDCPAAFSKNQGADISTLLPLREIKLALKNASAGLKLSAKIFSRDFLPKFKNDFFWPPEAVKLLTSYLNQGQLELNIFGGNPELHPDFLEIIKYGKSLGFKVTTTTTGKKFLYDKIFLTGFCENPPDLLALSADDYDGLKDLRKISKMPLDLLFAYWQKVNPLFGQRKKAYESVFTARLAETKEGFPPILFNIVVHPGNLSYIKKLLAELTELFPQSLVNPYPAQSSFDKEKPIWNATHLSSLEKFVDFMIENQLAQIKLSKKRFVPRLHYWLMLKSIFLTEKNEQALIKHLSGYEVWQCWVTPGAGRYLQATGKPDRTIKKPTLVGGHPGCFWNRHNVTLDRQLWEMKPQEISDFLLGGKTKLAKKNPDPCTGCLMPRLCFDGATLELGIVSKFQEKYLSLRKKYYSF